MNFLDGLNPYERGFMVGYIVGSLPVIIQLMIPERTFFRWVYGETK